MEAEMASIFLLRDLSMFLASSQNEKLWSKNKVFKRSGMNFCRENDKNPVFEGDRSSKKKVLLFLSYSTRVWWGTKALFLTSTIARTNSQIRGSIDKNLHSSPFVQKWPLRSQIYSTAACRSRLNFLKPFLPHFGLDPNTLVRDKTAFTSSNKPRYSRVDQTTCD